MIKTSTSNMKIYLNRVLFQNISKKKRYFKTYTKQHFCIFENLYKFV